MYLQELTLGSSLFTPILALSIEYYSDRLVYRASSNTVELCMGKSRHDRICIPPNCKDSCVFE